jgi:hypothetical protein
MPRLSKIGAAALAAFGWTSGAPAVTANYLVVAGGGAGGTADDGGGGGGAGGLRSTVNATGGGGSLEAPISLNTTLSYTVVVGAGGAGVLGNPNNGLGNNGTASSFSTITSVGGGGAGGHPAGILTGSSGGSGGGGGSRTPGNTGGAGTTNQGYAGGNGANSGGGDAGGGGGGAGAVGAAASGITSGGNGGVGVAVAISGTSTFYAGGGGAGGASSQGTGGNGGGGSATGTGSGGTSGTANTGGGGGGSNAHAAFSGSGGSGIVIISYPAPQRFGGGVITTSGGNIIHTFTTSGTLTPTTTLTASYLIVAGGGGGSAVSGNGCAGGGGAGGLVTGSGAVFSPTSTYLVTVGAGGAGVQSPSGAVQYGQDGTNSSISIVTTTAIGGGGGGGGDNAVGRSGGSGGGGQGSGGAGGAGTSGQGNAGGSGVSSGDQFTGGGGGAGAVGGNGNATGGGGNGGIGAVSTILSTTAATIAAVGQISGSSVYFSGGGGGGTQSTNPAGTGGLGGGGNGANNGATGGSGTDNTGGGGGGNGKGANPGGNGGSGVVIISYPGAQQMAGGQVVTDGANTLHIFKSSGYLTPLDFIGNSLRFRSSASAFLNRTPPVASNRKTFTFSAWIKRGELSTAEYSIFTGYTDTSNRWYVRFESNQFRIFWNVAGSSNEVATSAVFRDPAAWYHFVVAVDTTQATDTNRIRVFVNGVQQTLTGTYIPQNTDTQWNNNVVQQIGRKDTGGGFFDGYMTEINSVDGQALTPNSFGTFNSFGVWQPITYGGSYGTNGFYLPFNAGTSTFAGSFNGSNQSLSVAQNAAFNFGTGDFTIEACVYGNSWNSVNPIIVLGDGAVGGGSPVYSGWAMRYDSANGLGLYRFDGSETSLFSGATVPVNTWNHMAISRSSGTLRMFINGRQVYSAANTTSYNNVNSNSLKIGGNWVIGGGVVTWVNGFISNVRIVNNAGLYTSNFTPPTANLTAVSGTALLTLQNSSIVDNSTNAFSITNNNTVTTGQTYPFSAAKIFNDQGPAGNNWTPNNISGAIGSTLDYMTDVPTLTSTTAANYAVLNAVAAPTWAGTNFVNSNANLTCTYGYQTSPSTMAVTNSGQWYWEVTCVTNCGSGANNSRIGIVPFPYGTGTPGDMTGSYAYTANGAKGSGGTYASYGASYTDGDVIGIAFDSGAGTLTFYKNGTSQGTAYTGISGTFGAMNGSGSSSGTVSSFNFGQQPFKYTPPSGFVALNTFNL